MKHGPFKGTVLVVCTMKELRYEGVGLHVKCREVNQSALKTLYKCYYCAQNTFWHKFLEVHL